LLIRQNTVPCCIKYTLKDCLYSDLPAGCGHQGSFALSPLFVYNTGNGYIERGELDKFLQDIIRQRSSSVREEIFLKFNLVSCSNWRRHNFGAFCPQSY